MKILVYDVAASESGALGVLQEHHSRALRDKENEYVFVVSTPQFSEADHVKVMRYPRVKKGWAYRFLFDHFRAPRIVKEEQPDRVLSLQNMTIPHVSVPQTVYEHNCLFRPFTEYRFSILRDPNLWVRQNILGPLTIRSLKKADRVIVQTNWMKKRCADCLGISSEQIEVEQPVISNMPHGRCVLSETLQFIFPATGLSYKNHRVVIDALRIIAPAIRGKIKVLFTLDPQTDKAASLMLSEIDSANLPIEFVGWLTKERLFDYYCCSAILFPSKLESCPLPLLEGRCVGAPIIVADLEYAHDLLDQYERVVFFDPDSPIALANAIMVLMSSLGNTDSLRIDVIN